MQRLNVPLGDCAPSGSLAKNLNVVQAGVPSHPDGGVTRQHHCPPEQSLVAAVEIEPYVGLVARISSASPSASAKQFASTIYTM
jgi:hypothetical protein